MYNHCGYSPGLHRVVRHMIVFETQEGSLGLHVEDGTDDDYDLFSSEDYAQMGFALQNIGSHYIDAAHQSLAQELKLGNAGQLVEDALASFFNPEDMN